MKTRVILGLNDKSILHCYIPLPSRSRPRKITRWLEKIKL